MAKSRSTPRAKKSSRSVAKRASPAPKRAAKPAATKKKPRAARPKPALSTEARRKLLKLRKESDDVIEEVARIWEEHRAVKVPGLTPARLLRLLATAQRAAARERAQRERMESRLAPLQDARLLAEDAAFRALLDVNAAVKLHARRDVALGETFEFLLDHLRGDRGGEAPAPSPEPT